MSFLVKRQEDIMADYRRQFKVLAKLGKEISNSVLERVVITKLEVDKEQVEGSSSRLLPAQTTDGSNQMDVQGDLTMKNVDGKVDQGIENEVDFQSGASNEWLQDMGNKMSITSKFSEDVTVESEFAAPVKEVNSGVHSCILKMNLILFGAILGLLTKE